MRDDKDSDVGNEKLEETQLLAAEISVPPQDVEDTVRELKRRGLVAGEETFMQPTKAKFGWAVAAAAVFFVVGFGTASQTSRGEVPQGPQEINMEAAVDKRPEFMLIVREAKGMLQTDVPEIELIREYSAWAGRLAEQGYLVGGEKLNDTRRVLTQGNGELLVDAVPAVDVGEYVSGFFMIHANDYEEAVKIASECPHVGYGGIVEVREIYQG